MKTLVLFSCLSLWCFHSTNGKANLFQYEVKQAEDFVRHFEMDIGSHGVGDPFSWKDCSSPSPLVNIKSLSLSPDPLAFPGPLTVSTEFITKKTLVAPLKAELKVKKKILDVFVEIPCIDNIGSCTYDDVCQLLSQIPAGQCPDPLKKVGIDCACPLKQNDYNLQKAEFDIMASIIPSGEYEIVANLTESGVEAVCLQLKLTVV